MDKDLVKKRQRELSKQQAIYVAQRARGVSRQQSAIIAGYADVDKAGQQVEESELVQAELEKARRETALATGITKEQIATMLKDAFDIARTMADPQAMVRAASELGKMLGHYAPEVKKHLHGLDRESMDAIRALPDAELHKLARGKVIDGESKVVESTEE